MNRGFERTVKALFSLVGLHISRDWNPPVGNLESFLRDIKRRGLKCDYILDVGAYRGEFSELAITVYPDATLYLMEPLRESNNLLEAFCKKHPGSKFFSFAAGPANGTQALRIFDDLTWSGFMDVDIPDERTPRLVEVRTIDSMLESGEIQIPQLVKIDVQGYELEVLNGAQSLFGKTEMFIIEASLHNKHKSFPLMADVVAYMNERDYVVYDFAGFLRQHHDGSLVECDLCFIPRNSFLRK